MFIKKRIKKLIKHLSLLTIMDYKKHLPRKVIIVEVPMNLNSTNSKATIDFITQVKTDKDILLLESDIKHVRVKHKRFW